MSLGGGREKTHKNSKKLRKNLQVSKNCVPLHPRSRKTHKTEQIGAVVQLVRIPACHAGGRGFESRPHRRRGWLKSESLAILSLFFFEKPPLLTAQRKIPLTPRRLSSTTPVRGISSLAGSFLSFMSYSGMAGISSTSTRALTGWRSLLRAPSSMSLREVLMML